MALPTRWHEPSCKTPQVVVDGNVPECRSCGSSAEALLQRAADEPAPSYSGISLPPEAPIGQMDLWWPPCVPYTLNGVRRPRPEVSSGDAACLTPQGSALESSLSDIYPSTLEKDHFRLLYLSGSRLIDGPIHGALVDYPRDNCPEYETTSYTWGGEDGDATPCKPAYLGEFWDVLFVTRNCWSMLRYLRPPMGTRVVWVDAVCINQNDLPERGAQVSSMPEIYKNCMRVIIYPGDHLVRKEQHRFRQRVRHDEITTFGDNDSVDDSRFDLSGSVLQGRYINRIWIIQELILAPRSTLALRHHDLDLTNNLLYCVALKSKGRRWLEYMGQHHKLHQTKLIEGLQMMSENQATDPRDRIFGILGILGENLMFSQIVPDYSLSMRDCVIGALGLTLIHSEDIWPLLCVTTSKSRSDYPSWAPNLDELIVAHESETMERTFTQFPNLAPSNLVKEDREQWRTFISIQHIDHEQNYARSHAEDKEVQILEVAPKLSWSQDASIDAQCGALTLRLVRLFDKSHNVIIQRANNLINCIRFVVDGPSSAAWLTAAWLPELPEQPYHVFLAFGARTLNPSWGNKFPLEPKLRADEICILFASEAEASGTFILVGCCGLKSASFLSASPPPPPVPWALDLEETIDPKPRNIQSLFDILQQTLKYDGREQISQDRREIRCCEALPPELDNPDMNDRERSEMLLQFNNKYYLQDFEDNRVSEAMLFDMIIPGKGSAAPGLLQLSLSVARAGEVATVTEEFIRAYTACLQSIPADFDPVIDEEYVWFTLSDEDSLGRYWDSLLQHISDVVQFGGGRTEVTPWRPWDILFPRWFDLQIPGINRTDFDGSALSAASYMKVGILGAI